MASQVCFQKADPLLVFRTPHRRSIRIQRLGFSFWDPPGGLSEGTCRGLAFRAWLEIYPGGMPHRSGPQSRGSAEPLIYSS